MARRAREPFAVRARKFDGTPRFHTVGQDAPVWESDVARIGPGGESGGAAPVTAGGAFVRLRPPPGIGDAELRNVLEAYRQVARAVTVERARVAPVVAPATDPGGSVADHREVVAAMVEESRSGDRDALREVCEGVMAEVGI